MTDVILTEQEKRKPGRPRKEDNSAEIKKADVVSDYTRVDPWLVRNPNPNMRYVWGRLDDDMEMMEFAAKQYVPATGNEIIVGNPFEATQCGEGKQKIRGKRILMCCPKEIVEARQREQALKDKSASESANRDSRKLAARTKLGALNIEETHETVRESIKEPIKVKSEE